MKKWIIVVVALVVIGAGIFLFSWFRSQRAMASANFQTVPAERGSLTGTVPTAGLRMCYILLKEAVRRGADVIATICPRYEGSVRTS